MTQEPQIDFKLVPIHSSSENSFMGQIGSQRVFVKLNASPILPSLSTEGITPKIVWIRKTPSGDTLTAQAWISGHFLSGEELFDPQVNQIFNTMHNSRALRDSLSTFDRSVARPAELLGKLLVENSPIMNNSYLKKVAKQMMATVPTLNNLNIVVVHGDVRPTHWLKEEETGQVYLIDWDTVRLGDAFYDIAAYLSHNVERKDWGVWLARSGYNSHDILILSKINWYGKLSFLQEASAYIEAGDLSAANSEILGLRRFSEYF